MPIGPSCGARFRPAYNIVNMTPCNKVPAEIEGRSFPHTPIGGERCVGPYYPRQKWAQSWRVIVGVVSLFLGRGGRCCDEQKFWVYHKDGGRSDGVICVPLIGPTFKLLPDSIPT